KRRIGRRALRAWTHCESREDERRRDDRRRDGRTKHAWCITYVIRKISEALACALTLAAGPIALTQNAKPQPTIKYVCPMEQDADVIEDKPGKCPRCGMTLVPGAFVYTCPVHAAITEANPGKCPIDGRELVRVTMFVTWTCPG